MESKPLFPFMDEINAAIAATKEAKGPSSASLPILTAPSTTITYDKVSLGINNLRPLLISSSLTNDFSLDSRVTV